MCHFTRMAASISHARATVAKVDVGHDRRPIDTARGLPDHVALPIERESYRRAVEAGTGAVDLNGHAMGIRKSEQDVIEQVRRKMDMDDVQRIAAYYAERYPVLSQNVRAGEWSEMALRLFVGETPEEQQRILASLADKAKPDSSAGRSMTQPATTFTGAVEAIKGELGKAMDGVREYQRSRAAKHERPLLDTAYNRDAVERRIVAKFDTSVPGSMTRPRKLVIEKDVRRLFDADVTHISLVKRAATRAPFKVMKLDSGDGMSEFDRFLGAVARGAVALG